MKVLQPVSRHVSPVTDMNREASPANGSRCAKCGACSVVCPLYQVSGREALTARGKLHLLSRLEPAAGSTAYADILSRCLLCGACREICPRGVDVPACIVAGREVLPRKADRHFWPKYLARQALAHPRLLGRTFRLAIGLGRHLPPESGLRLRLGLITAAPEGLPRHGRFVNEAPAVGSPTVSYFAGCLADHLEPGIARATSALTLQATGALPAVPGGQSCCGQAAYACGDLSLARRLAKRNILAFADSEHPILTSCASCYRHLLAYPELLQEDSAWHERAVAFAARLRELSTFLQGTFVPEPHGGRTVFYHDPCHLRHGLGITAAPRQLLAAAGFNLVELPDGPRCCGQGGLFHLAHPDLSAQVRDQLFAAFRPLGAELVTTTCSGCLLQWRQGLAATGSETRIKHLAEVLAEQGLSPGKISVPA